MANTCVGDRCAAGAFVDSDDFPVSAKKALFPPY